MTVEELIKVLSTFPQDLPVVVDGYEGGVDDKFEVQRAKVKWDAYKEGYDYFGDHDVLRWEGDPEYADGTDVVYFER